MNLATLKQLNLERWHRCEILPNRLKEVMATGKRLIAPKARYQAISQAVWGAPERWWFIAIVHERESGQNFMTQLGQGDPLNQVSRHVPRGMGPYLNHPDDPPGQDAFYRCCIDVLMNSAPFAGKWTDWTIGGVLTLWILYNGTGYEDYHHEASPYDWGATNIEQWGKYVQDGRFDAHVWDTQVGCAAMLKAMMILDPTIKVEGSEVMGQAVA